MKSFFISPFWRASFYLSGMIIGVGIYALPYVFSRVGFLLGLSELLILTVVTVFIHLIYGEIVLRTKAFHQLPGYANIYLGPFAKKVSTLSYIIAFSLGLGSFVILGGEFLSNLFPIGEIAAYLFFLLGAFLLYFSIRFNAKIDTFLVCGLTALVFIFFAMAFPHIKSGNFLTLDLSQWFLPYGVIMFALAGMAAIPDMVAILENHPRLLRRAIVTGTLLPAVLYILFVIAVLGVSGVGTSAEALRGVAGIVGRPILIAGSLLGILSTFTSFLVLGSIFKGMLHSDLHFSWRMSWVLTVAMPFLFLFFGIKNYLAVIGFIGSIALATDGLMTLAIYRKAVHQGDRHSEYTLHIPLPTLFVIGCIFIFGIVSTFLF